MNILKKNLNIFLQKGYGQKNARRSRFVRISEYFPEMKKILKISTNLELNKLIKNFFNDFFATFLILLKLTNKYIYILVRGTDSYLEKITEDDNTVIGQYRHTNNSEIIQKFFEIIEKYFHEDLELIKEQINKKKTIIDKRKYIFEFMLDNLRGYRNQVELLYTQIVEIMEQYNGYAIISTEFYDYIKRTLEETIQSLNSRVIYTPAKILEFLERIKALGNVPSIEKFAMDNDIVIDIIPSEVMDNIIDYFQNKYNNNQIIIDEFKKDNKTLNYDNKLKEINLTTRKEIDEFIEDYELRKATLNEDISIIINKKGGNIENKVQAETANFINTLIEYLKINQKELKFKEIINFKKEKVDTIVKSIRKKNKLLLILVILYLNILVKLKKNIKEVCLADPSMINEIFKDKRLQIYHLINKRNIYQYGGTIETLIHNENHKLIENLSKLISLDDLENNTNILISKITKTDIDIKKKDYTKLFINLILTIILEISIIHKKSKDLCLANPLVDIKLKFKEIIIQYKHLIKFIQ